MSLVAGRDRARADRSARAGSRGAQRRVRRHRDLSRRRARARRATVAASIGLSYEAHEAMALAEFGAIAGEVDATLSADAPGDRSTVSANCTSATIAVAVCAASPHRARSLRSMRVRDRPTQSARPDLEEGTLRRRQRRVDRQRGARRAVSVSLWRIASRRQRRRGARISAAPRARRRAGRRTRLFIEQAQLGFLVLVSFQPRVPRLQLRFSRTQTRRERRLAARHGRLRRCDGGGRCAPRANAARPRFIRWVTAWVRRPRCLLAAQDASIDGAIAIATGYGRPSCAYGASRGGRNGFSFVVRRRRRSADALCRCRCTLRS